METKLVGIQTKQRYFRTAKRKHWKEGDRSVSLLTLGQAKNQSHSSLCITSAFGTKEHVVCESTPFGILPTFIESVSPDELSKTVYTFTYITE